MTATAPKTVWILAWALREVGRVEKSLFDLAWLQSPPLRRRVQVGLNKGEARNGLARSEISHCCGPDSNLLTPLCRQNTLNGAVLKLLADYRDAGCHGHFLRVAKGL